MVYSIVYTYSLLPDYLRTKICIVQLLNGKSCSIRAAQSEVILHVPEGVHGVLLANIHTNAVKFFRLIPEHECLLGPICEYHVLPYLDEVCLGKRKRIRSLTRSQEKYKIQIPHSVRDIERVRPHLKLRHFFRALYDDTGILTQASDQDECSIDDKYVTILTSHFSVYIITAEGVRCCGQTANLLFFGSLINRSDTQPLATVKVFISNKIEGNQKVSLFL